MPHIQIKHVPPDLHERLRRRAASGGMTLSEYLLSELEEIAGLPTLEEWLALVERERGRSIVGSAAELVRADRDEHAGTACRC